MAEVRAAASSEDVEPWQRLLQLSIAAGEFAGVAIIQDLAFVEFGVAHPRHPETVTRWWREAVAKAGVPPIRLHDARHTAATIMLRSGVPVKVVTQRLGHADVAVTMRVYQHVTAQDAAEAADALGRALGGS